MPTSQLSKEPNDAMTMTDVNPSTARRPDGVTFAAPRYVLPNLPYDPAALEPHYRAETLLLHHDRHHAGYVAGANRAVELLAEARLHHDWVAINQFEADLAFHVSGHVLHSIFWTNLAPNGGGEPAGDLRAALDDSFGSFDLFKKQFTRSALGVHGSGWAVLAWEPAARCAVVEQLHDHLSSGIQGSQPILVCDVWEHAYYLQYRHSRADWVQAFWQLVNWSDVERRLITTTNDDQPLIAPFAWPLRLGTA